MRGVEAVEQVARVVSVNVGRAVTGEWTGRQGRTGIDKRAVPGRVPVRGDRVGADVVVDTPSHGGPDKAVYAYAREDAAWWERELARELVPGAFGENLTTAGLDVTGAVIGERWAVGSTVLEVSEPRIPCRVFAGFWQVPDLVRRFTAAAMPGAYLRIRVEGDVGAGDAVRVVHRPTHGVTIGEVFRARAGERGLLARVAEASELPAAWHAWSGRLLAGAR